MKGTCDAAAPTATVLGLMVGFDEVLKEAGSNAVFIPAVANLFKVIIPVTALNPDVSNNLNFIKQTVVTQIQANVTDSKIIEATKELIKKEGLSWGLNHNEIESMVSDCDFSKDSLETNNKILRDQIKKSLTEYTEGLIDNNNNNSLETKIKELTKK